MCVFQSLTEVAGGRAGRPSAVSGIFQFKSLDQSEPLEPSIKTPHQDDIAEGKFGWPGGSAGLQ